VREIPLTKGKSAWVDDADHQRVSALKWHATRDHRHPERYYAYRKIGHRGPSQSMHCFIMQPPKGMEVDHEDGDGLNNQRNNLRVCTKSQNMANMVSRTNRHGFKGVARHKFGWMAQIQQNKKRHCSYHDTPEEAARAYDSMARRLFGTFAKTNFKETEVPCGTSSQEA